MMLVKKILEEEMRQMWPADDTMTLNLAAEGPEKRGVPLVGGAAGHFQNCVEIHWVRTFRYIRQTPNADHMSNNLTLTSSP